MNNTKTILAAASFAAQRHSGQARKGSAKEPYINHPLEVANIIANIGGVDDPDVIVAALLHDTVEDTATTRGEISEQFGERVAEIVLEVTDDKSLDKAERKQRQIEHAPHLSREAKIVKLADKISNITDVVNNPPDGWSLERRQEYVTWGENVVAGLRGANPALEARFDEIVRTARENLT